MPVSSHQDSAQAAQDLAVCRRLLAEGSHSFDLAARLLPRSARADATALYAFCRVADDVIDDGPDPRAGLQDLKERLAAIEQGTPQDHAVDRAVAGVLERHAIPISVLEALIEGLSWDVSGRGYADVDALVDYGARVAATVGVMMTCLMDRRDPDTLLRAAQLGVAMQLTNIARDILDDRANARCYVPARWRRAAFGHEAMPSVAEWRSPAGRALVARLLETADRYYGAAWPGISALPGRCRSAIRAAALIYREIGQEIARRGFDVGEGRAVVVRRRKLALVARAVIRPRQRPGADALVAPESRLSFLVAATARPAPSSAAISPKNLRWWQLGAQWAWAIELFGKLAVRERLDRPRSATLNETSGFSSTSSR